jgi:hypothetical protein
MHRPSSKAAPALTTPLRTPSPWSRSICTGSPVSHRLDEDGCGAFQAAVEGTDVTGTDDEQVTDDYLSQWHCGHSHACAPVCRAWRVFEQGAQVVGGTPLRRGLQSAPCGKHQRDQSTGQELAHGRGPAERIPTRPFSIRRYRIE